MRQAEPYGPTTHMLGRNRGGQLHVARLITARRPPVLDGIQIGFACLPAGTELGDLRPAAGPLRPVLRVALVVQPQGVELIECIATSRAEFW